MELQERLDDLARAVVVPPSDLARWNRIARRRHTRRRVVSTCVMVLVAVSATSLVWDSRPEQPLVPAYATADPPSLEYAEKVATYVIPQSKLDGTQELPTGPVGATSALGEGDRARNRIGGFTFGVKSADGASLSVTWQVLSPAVEEHDARRLLQRDVPEGATHIVSSGDHVLYARVSNNTVFGLAHSKSGAVAQVQGSGVGDVGQVLWLLRALVRDPDERDPGEALLGAAFKKQTFASLAEAASADLQRQPDTHIGPWSVDCISTQDAKRFASSHHQPSVGPDGRAPDGQAVVRVTGLYASKGAAPTQVIVLFDAVNGSVIHVDSGTTPGSDVSYVAAPAVPCPPEY